MANKFAGLKDWGGRIYIIDTKRLLVTQHLPDARDIHFFERD
jgi:hypothetical protein